MVRGLKEEIIPIKMSSLFIMEIWNGKDKVKSNDLQQ
jgi:hypothetical protein